MIPLTAYGAFEFNSQDVNIETYGRKPSKNVPDGIREWNGVKIASVAMVGRQNCKDGGYEIGGAFPAFNVYVEYVPVFTGRAAEFLHQAGLANPTWRQHQNVLSLFQTFPQAIQLVCPTKEILADNRRSSCVAHIRISDEKSDAP